MGGVGGAHDSVTGSQATPKQQVDTAAAAGCTLYPLVVDVSVVVAAVLKGGHFKLTRGSGSGSGSNSLGALLVLAKLGTTAGKASLQALYVQVQVHAQLERQFEVAASLSCAWGRLGPVGSGLGNQPKLPNRWCVCFFFCSNNHQGPPATETVSWRSPAQPGPRTPPPQGRIFARKSSEKARRASEHLFSTFAAHSPPKMLGFCSNES